VQTGIGRLYEAERLGRVVRFNGHRGRNLERQQRLGYDNRRVAPTEQDPNGASRRTGCRTNRSTLTPTGCRTDARAEPGCTGDSSGIPSHRCRTFANQ